jgi:hypothetical protein
MSEREAKVPEADDDDDIGLSIGWESFRDLYLSFDKRTLGLTRILLGFYLIFDLLRRSRDWLKLFSNTGVLPAHHNLYRPQSSGWSLVNAFSQPEELYLLWGFALMVYLCVLVGYKTRVAQVIAAVLVASMNGRVLLVENGGYVVQNLLLLWTAFLPLGERFSLDALLASLRARREQGAAELNDRSTDVAPERLRLHVSFVGFVIMMQLFAIYFFNVVHKTGPNWRNATAVHFVLYNDRMANPIIAQLRDYVPNWMVYFLSRSVMGLEAAIPICVLSPLARVWSRRFAIACIVMLHIGFGSSFTLGPFAWALCVWSSLLLSSEDWDLAFTAMRRPRRARVVLFDPASPRALFTCRLLRRLDRFELLRFEEKAGVRGLQLRGPERSKALSGRGAAIGITQALPVGPFLALPLRAPLLGDALLALSRGVGGLLRHGAARGHAPRDTLAHERARREGWATFDIDFVRRWLERYDAEHRLGARRQVISMALLVVGLLLAVFGAPTMQRFKLNPKLQAIGPLTYAELMFWPGIALALVGAWMLARPYLRMTMQTPSSPAMKWMRVRTALRELFVAVMFVGAINQALVELWVFRGAKIPQPPATAALSHKLRYLQGWFMFSPNPVMDDGTIVVDALTVDGRHVDPFTVDWHPYTLREPNFDFSNVKSFYYNQIWSDYFNRMHMPANTAHRRPMKEYMFRLPERTGNPDDALVSGVVYWMHDMNPRWNSTRSYGLERKELFRFRNPDQEVQRLARERGIEPQPLKAPRVGG